MPRLRFAAFATYFLLVAAGIFGAQPGYGTHRDVANLTWSAPFVMAGVLGMVGVGRGFWWLERVALTVAAIGVAARIAMLAVMAFTQPSETVARCLILALVLVQLWTRYLRVSGLYLDPERGQT